MYFGMLFACISHVLLCIIACAALGSPSWESGHHTCNYAVGIKTSPTTTNYSRLDCNRPIWQHQPFLPTTNRVRSTQQLNLLPLQQAETADLQTEPPIDYLQFIQNPIEQCEPPKILISLVWLSKTRFSSVQGLGKYGDFFIKKTNKWLLWRAISSLILNLDRVNKEEK